MAKTTTQWRARVGFSVGKTWLDGIVVEKAITSRRGTPAQAGRVQRGCHCILAAVSATWPKRRLVASEAAERWEFATLALIPPGRKLYPNKLALRADTVLVEIAERHRKSLSRRASHDGSRWSGTRSEPAVNWKGGHDLAHRWRASSFG